MPASPAAQVLTVPTGALVAGVLLLAGPIDANSTLGRLAAPDLRALDEHGLRAGGRLVPWFATVVELIAWPDLVAELIRQEAASAPVRTIVWARPEAAVLGTATDGVVALEPIAIGDVVDRVAAMCAVGEHEDVRVHPFRAADLLGALLADDGPRVADVLDRAWAARSPDAPAMTAAAASTHPTAWRLDARWTDAHGPAGGTLLGLDAGVLGTWEVRGPHGPHDLRITDAATVRRRIADLLPPDAGRRPRPPKPAAPASEDRP